MKKIPLTQGLFAIVDDHDYDWLSMHKWHAAKYNGYVYARRAASHKMGKKPLIYMHREILGLKVGDGKLVDHFSHNCVDNRRNNLRVCTTQQNGANRRKVAKCKSAYKGVSQSGSGNRWRAQITHDGRTIHIGCYNTQLEAANAYDIKARILFGTFAKVNVELAT